MVIYAHDYNNSFISQKNEMKFVMMVMLQYLNHYPCFHSSPIDKSTTQQKCIASQVSLELSQLGAAH